MRAGKRWAGPVGNLTISEGPGEEWGCGGVLLVYTYSVGPGHPQTDSSTLVYIRYPC